LWIAFRLYLWHIGHNVITISKGSSLVVNCFQIVSLTYWSQRFIRWPLMIHRCELLSDCIFDILVTTSTLKALALRSLWIAFRLYLWHIGHNACAPSTPKEIVVNCFQIVSLTYWSQRYPTVEATHPSCELLSDCIFDILVTTDPDNKSIKGWLWIAFRLYLWHIGHNAPRTLNPLGLVVNCFQIVSLTYWSQRVGSWRDNLCSCELLSDCIFDILVTTLSLVTT